MAVLIVPTTAPEEIEPYGIRVAEAWRLGREKSDDGALLLVAKDDHRVRIEVGRGLEGALTDLQSKRIIDETIVPSFRAGDFAGGIDAGVDRILAVIEGEALPPPAAGGAGPGFEQWAPLVLTVAPVLAFLLRMLLGPLVAALVAAAIAWLVTGQLLVALGVGVFMLLFGALLTTRHGWSSRGAGRGWGGGGFGGGGGGFSGGGGGFSGGGASGSW